MTQSSCATLERKMGGNGGRNLAVQRSKQLFWNQESVPQVSTLPEFNRMEGTGVFLLLQLQTAFVWACWMWFCQGMWFHTTCARHPPGLSVSLGDMIILSSNSILSPGFGQSWNSGSRLSTGLSHLVVAYCTRSSPCKSKAQKWPPGLGISW